VHSIWCVLCTRIVPDPFALVTTRWQAYSASSNAYLVVQGANTYSPEAKLARLKQRIAEKQAKNSPRLPDSASRQALSNDDLQVLTCGHGNVGI
jgi:hypothetical protein